MNDKKFTSSAVLFFIQELCLHLAGCLLDFLFDPEEEIRYAPLKRL
jgi:hypothetical protein